MQKDNELCDLEKVAQTVRGARKHLPDTEDAVRVVLCGSLCTKDDIIYRALCDILSNEGYSISVCEEPLILGAYKDNILKREKALLSAYKYRASQKLTLFFEMPLFLSFFRF